MVLRTRLRSGIPLAYLQALHAEYERFISDISRSVPVIRVDWARFRSAEEMAEMLVRELNDHSFLREAQWAPTRG